MMDLSKFKRQWLLAHFVCWCGWSMWGQMTVSPMGQTCLDSMQHIPEVAVVATAKKNYVLPPQRLEGKRLQALTSYSVADAVRYFAGVQLKDYGGVGGIKTVDVRSMGTHHMGVFYDGIQLGNAQNGQIDLGKFSLDNIEEVALYNGQKSDIFQSAKDYGSSGTIYLKTKRPKFEPNKTYNIHLTMRAGSFGLANPSFLWEHKITDNISSSLSAEYMYATGKYKFRYRKVLPNGHVAWDTTALRQNGDVNALRVEGGFFGYMPNGKWLLKGYFYDSERGIPGAIINNVWTNAQRQWDRNAFVQASFQKEWLKGYDFMLNAKYANDYMRYLNPDTTLMFIDNNFLQQEVYLSMVNKYSILPQWDVSLSVDYQWNTLQSNMYNFVNPERHSLWIAAATALKIWRIRAQANVLATYVYDNTHTPEGEKQCMRNEWNVTPACFLNYEVIKGLDVVAFYKQAFRMPTFNDLYYTDIGNVSLKPEITTQYDVGAHYDKYWYSGFFRQLSVKTDAYFNQVENKIIAVPKGNGQYRWMMMNIGYVEIMGCDVSLKTKMRFPYDVFLNVGLNYTYQQAHDMSDPTDNDPIYGTYKKQIAYIPWHSGSATAQLTYKTWELNYSFSYVGERYHNSANIPANYEQPWHTHDINLAKDFEFKKWRLRIAAEVNNLLNQHYEVIQNYPMPGINYKGILKIMF